LQRRAVSILLKVAREFIEYRLGAKIWKNLRKEGLSNLSPTYLRRLGIETSDLAESTELDRRLRATLSHYRLL